MDCSCCCCCCTYLVVLFQFNDMKWANYFGFVLQKHSVCCIVVDALPLCESLSVCTLYNVHIAMCVWIPFSFHNIFYLSDCAI